MSEINYSLDTSLISAKHDLITRGWDFKNIFSISVDVLLRVTADDIFGWFTNTYPELEYRIEFGKYCIMWNDEITVRFDGQFGLAVLKPNMPKRYDDEITLAGRKEVVEKIAKDFVAAFEDRKIDRNHNVDWVSLGSNGLETVTIPVKSGQVIVPEMYPIFGGRTPDEFIDDYLASSANVLILTGPPGLGKSAFINHLVLKSGLRSQVVYDHNVMKVDQLYSSFIQRCFRDEGGMMIMEDADLVLTSREVSGNELMSKILNISDGIINTSAAKFVFTANLNNTNDIDEALTRPGRCFDIVNFRNLTRNEAEKAAAVIGKELVGDKNEYTVAEIYNQKDDAASRNKLGNTGIGFGFGIPRK